MVAAIGYQTIGGIVSKETVCCVGGKVKHCKKCMETQKENL